MIDLKPDEPPQPSAPETPGAEPANIGLGATGGGVAGAAIGTAVGGPIGAAIGAALGGLIGGLVVKEAGEGVDLAAEEAYWRNEHARQDFVASSSRTYEDYAPAYRVGYVGYAKYGTEARFDEVIEDLRREFETPGGPPRIDWEEARPAALRAWGRVERGEAFRLRTRAQV